MRTKVFLRAIPLFACLLGWFVAPVKSAEELSRTNLLQFIAEGRLQPVRST
jgi:hypothetical protein